MSSDVPTPRPHERRFWYLKTPEGNVYGPTAWEQLQNWVEQGRVTADCQLAPGEGRDWQPADEIFSQLRPKPAVAIPVAPAAAPPADSSSPVPAAPPRVAAPALDDAAPFRRSHRGGLILILGVLGVVVACPIFSLMAWVMGSDDLRGIDTGEIDAAGRDYTLIGQRLGMVLSLVWIVGCMAALFVMLVTGYRG